ncbi:unnamed protein product [Effrenium voratum]|uniref:Uncharacterized protein n=1 Tax=Effrenium voratum TaxID=2562239 RepID=A0AA36J5P4_9DINO|nr:unnamed protein product [Effrenium voratum]
MLRLAACLLGFASGSQLSPVAKAVELLEQMRVRGDSELREEELQYGRLQQWCLDKQRGKAKEVDEDAEKEERLVSEVQSAVAKVRGLQKDVEDLNSKLLKWDQERSSAEELRKDEASEVRGSARQLETSLGQLRRAEEKLSRVQEPQLMQLDLSEDLKQALQADADGGVLEMLQTLRGKLEGELKELSVKETSANQANELTLKKLGSQKEAAAARLREKTAALGAGEEEQRRAEADLDALRQEAKEDSTYLEDLKVMCSMKADAFQRRQQGRQKELRALGSALQLLKQKVAFLQRGTSLAQLPSAQAERAAALRLLRSTGLVQLGQALRDQPLAKVKTMIKDMLSRLEQAHAALGAEEAFCEKELAASELKEGVARKRKEELRGRLDETLADSQQLAEDRAVLEASLAELSAELQEATKEREDSKSKNLVDIKEAQESREALLEALVALREIYQAPTFVQLKVKSESEQVLQGPAKDAPDFPDDDYAPRSESSGLLDLLELAESSFAAQKATAEDAETADEGQYQKFLEDNAKDKAVKSRQLARRKEKAAQTQREVKMMQGELADTKQQLLKLDDYLAKLKQKSSTMPRQVSRRLRGEGSRARCLKPAPSFEEKQQKRREEISTLEEVLKILSV